MFPVNSLPESDKMRDLWTLIGYMMALMALGQNILNTLLPKFGVILEIISKIFFSHSSDSSFNISEIDGDKTNELYKDVQLYISTILSVSTDAAAEAVVDSCFNLSRVKNSDQITYSLSKGDTVHDTHNNVPILWQHDSEPQFNSMDSRTPPVEKRCFTLSFKKRDRNLVLNSYLPHIKQTAADIRHKNKGRLLYTNSKDRSHLSHRDGWQSIPFKHPSTFDTLAMDPDKKEEIMNDLNEFAFNGKNFYEKTGRAWKRGYLLYGPPGTGKSSMIAAMANFLSYDIYFLELTAVSNNTELRKLLMNTSSKSIIVIEDIDCSINLTNRADEKPPEAKNEEVEDTTTAKAKSRSESNQITLSGMLNATDGLWSCCESERIFVFTTNYVDKLDPGLLRSGRMDMHICLSYCSFESLKIFLKNYLDYTNDDLSPEVWDEMKQLVEKARITPSDVAEHLIKHKRNKEKAVQELIRAMKLNVEENARTEAKGTEPDSETERDKAALVSDEKDIGLTELSG